MDTHGGMVRFRRGFALIVENHRAEIVILFLHRPNQSMKPAAPLRSKFSVFATRPCRAAYLCRVRAMDVPSTEDGIRTAFRIGGDVW